MYTDGQGGLLFHTSFLVDLDVDFMLKVLRIPASKLADKGAAAVAERVTTVRRELGRPVDVGTLRGRRRGFRHPLRDKAGRCQPDEAEPRPRTSWSREVRQPILARRAGRATRRHRKRRVPLPEGLVRVFVAAQGALIKSVLFTGDFNTVPAGLRQLEHALRWRHLDAAPSGLGGEVRSATGRRRRMGRDKDVVAAVLDAGAQAISGSVPPSGPPDRVTSLNSKGALVT